MVEAGAETKNHNTRRRGFMGRLWEKMRLKFEMRYLAIIPLVWVLFWYYPYAIGYSVWHIFWLCPVTTIIYSVGLLTKSRHLISIGFIGVIISPLLNTLVWLAGAAPYLSEPILWYHQLIPFYLPLGFKVAKENREWLFIGICGLGAFGTGTNLLSGQLVNSIDFFPPSRVPAQTAALFAALVVGLVLFSIYKIFSQRRKGKGVIKA